VAACGGMSTGSELLDDLAARRASIRQRWYARRPKPIPVFPPLPRQPPKPLEERLAEARALRGILPKQQVDKIIKNIRESATDFGERVALPTPRRSSLHRKKHKIENAPGISVIQHIVAAHYNVGMDGLFSRTRTSLELPRMASMYLARTLTSCGLSEIGLAFGRHHTSVFNAERKIAERVIIDPAFADEISAIKMKIIHGCHD
jgi:Bacterial dnaA protein helix-turn-helix